MEGGRASNPRAKTSGHGSFQIRCVGAGGSGGLEAEGGGGRGSGEETPPREGLRRVVHLSRPRQGEEQQDRGAIWAGLPQTMGTQMGRPCASRLRTDPFPARLCLCWASLPEGGPLDPSLKYSLF